MGAVICARPYRRRVKRDGHTDGQIRIMLEGARRVAVVGMSRSAAKAAGHIPRYLAGCGYDVVPVNPNADNIGGRRSYSSIAEVEGKIDIVDIFRPSDQAASVVREALAKRPGMIWLQEGIYSGEAEELARREGVPLVYNRCIMVEHQRLVGASGHPDL
ncbi:MAG: CoA-binding protein [Nitrosopumilaceae archaeon]|nr:CoA-binding protein [Nitrosopumilaceae archaeon]